MSKYANLFVAAPVALSLSLASAEPAHAGLLKWLVMAGVGACSISKPCINKIVGMKQNIVQGAGPTLATKCANNPTCAALAAKVVGQSH